MNNGFFSDPFLDPIIRSLIVAIVSSLFCLVAGTGLGYVFANARFKGKMILETILMLPLVLPPSVVGFGLLVLFGRESLAGKALEWLIHQPIVFTIWAAMVASFVVAFPLMFQTVKNGFMAVDAEIRDAAQIDGAGKRALFFYIDLPLAKPAVITGGLLAFARSIGEFGATLMIAGNIPGKTQTMPTAIYIAVETNHTALAWGWVACTVIFSFVLLLFVYSFRKTFN
ncbi:MAG: molybdate ABC transporter permease subunit [Tuberibacillus sp.]